MDVKTFSTHYSDFIYLFMKVLQHKCCADGQQNATPLYVSPLAVLYHHYHGDITQTIIMTGEHTIVCSR